MINYTDYLIEDYLLEWSSAQIQEFKNKFGDNLFKSFQAAKDRLKANGHTTDIQYYLSNKFNTEDLEPLLLSLYKDSEDQRKREITNIIKQVRGKYNFLGEHDGYLVYQPLDYIASMDLGINTGWCTAGRYGHAGHPEFTPDKNAAEKHFNRYVGNYGVKLYYFLDKKTFYGIYAIALYPEMLDNSTNRYIENVYNKITNIVTHIDRLNFEIYDARDNLILPSKEDVVYNIAKYKLDLDLQFESYSNIVKDGFEIDKNNVLIKYWMKKSNIKIPDDVISIGERAFAEHRSLIKIEMPDSIIKIGKWAFESCIQLSDIKLSNNIKIIEAYAFYSCWCLKEIKLPNTLIDIKEGAFQKCTYLTSIEIPSSIKSIAASTFADCDHLRSIKISNNVANIGAAAFIDCTSLTNIEMPNSLKSIDRMAFRNCTNLTSIEIPSSLMSIGDDAFYKCDSLSYFLYTGNNKKIIDELTKYADILDPETGEVLYQKKNQ